MPARYDADLGLPNGPSVRAANGVKPQLLPKHTKTALRSFCPGDRAGTRGWLPRNYPPKDGPGDKLKEGWRFVSCTSFA